MASGVDADLKRLEEIVAEMERGKLDLERAMAMFEEGVSVARRVSESLKRAELKVKEVTDEGLRELRTAEVDAGNGERAG